MGAKVLRDCIRLLRQSKSKKELISKIRSFNEQGNLGFFDYINSGSGCEVISNYYNAALDKFQVNIFRVDFKEWRKNIV